MSQYRDLLRLINYQKDKLSSQQAELTKVSVFGSREFDISRMKGIKSFFISV